MDYIAFVNQFAYYCGAIVIALSCMIYTLIQNNTDRPRTKIFLMSLAITIITGVCEMLSVYFLSFAPRLAFARYGLEATNFIYFATHNLLGLFMCFYIFFATQNFSRLRGVTVTTLVIPCAVSEMLIISNPWNHWTWHLDSAYQFHRGWGEYTMYLGAAFYFTLAFAVVIFRWQVVSKRKRLLVILSFLVMAAGVLIQMALPNVMVEIFAESVSFMGIMLSIEYDDDRMDQQTRMYSRRAFTQDIKYYFATKSKFQVVCFRIPNLDAYQRMPNALPMPELFGRLAGELIRVYPRFHMYRVTDSSIVILMHNKTQREAYVVAQKISDLVKTVFPRLLEDERLQYTILVADVPSELREPYDLMLLCEADLPWAENGGILRREDLRYIFERAEIERELQRGVADDAFEVYYQLVFEDDCKTVHSAEALLRLRDEKGLIITPSTFIPVAEQTGMIDQIGAWVLSEVCDFWRSGLPEELGINYINVNLSVIQCMQSKFIDMVKDIVDSAGIAHEKINFEITESVSAGDYKYLNRVMKECKELGFRFSMEGYGTGYSNMYSVFNLDYDEIKLDRTMIWEADKSDEGRAILENSVRMIHEMRLPVVAVGVESPKQLERVKMLGVDLLQGFYFTKPMSRAELQELKG